jgi:hypothetical protein
MEQWKEDFMEDKKWMHAAWMAIGAAVLMPANFLLGILADLSAHSGPAGVVVAVTALIVGIAAAGLSLIAMYRFRELLNERYEYHGIDALITFVIIAIVALNGFLVVGRLSTALLGTGDVTIAAALIAVVPIVLIGVATGIVNIILGIKLLSLESDPQHLIRPYAVVSILTGACFALVLLAPLGYLMLIAGNIVLALMFFRAGESEPVVEFV